MATRRIIVAGLEVSTSDPIVMTSTDALTWTEVTSWPGAAATAVSVAGGAYFVQTAAPASANNYAYSTDGDNWTLATLNGSTPNVTYTGTEYITARTTAAYTSTLPGGSWSGPYTTGTSAVIRQLAYGNGVAMGVGSTGLVIYSTDDGVTWSTYTPANAGNTNDVIYTGTQFLAVRTRFGAVDDALLTFDGTTFALANTGINNRGWYSLAQGNGLIVAIGQDGSGAVGASYRTMVSSDGGSTWTGYDVSSTCVINSLSRIEFWAGLFVVVSPTNGTIWTSADGQTFTANVFADRDWAGVAAGEAIRRGRRGLGAMVR